MIPIHAIWADSNLHLWGLDFSDQPELDLSEQTTLAFKPAAEDQLRLALGDLWDSLLVSGASGGELEILLPFSGEVLANCPQNLDSETIKLSPRRVQTLVFAPPDAVDLLTSLPIHARHDIKITESMRFWAKVAQLVLEILAKQKFVPDVHRSADAHYLGFWRAAVNDEEFSRRLSTLIETMPPVCRAVSSPDENLQASVLIENFLWTTVDALVRRSLEGDELAHSLHERSDDESTLETRWLQSLVRSEDSLHGDAAQCDTIWQLVQGWLGKLSPGPAERTCQTCLKLHPPADDPSVDSDPNAEWRLSLHVQAIDNPESVVDAEDLFGDRMTSPLILERPFISAREQIRTDLEQAAKHFPPLARLLAQERPVEQNLTVQEAYSFLRGAAVMLEHEGFVIWLPRWWRTHRPRLGMKLNLGSASAIENDDSSVNLNTLIDYDWQIALGDHELPREEIEALIHSKTPLVRLRGQWIEVKPSEIETAIRFLERSQTGRMTVFEALRHSYMADELETGLPFIGLRTAGWLQKLVESKHADETIQCVEPPEGFEGTLRPYQLKGLEWLRFLTKHGLGACLADDMGLGKTIQLIGLLLSERENNQSPGPTLLIVPMSLVGNWQREIARFAPSLKVMIHHGLDRLTGQEFVDDAATSDLVISTYGLAHRDLDHLASVKWYRAALDEAQNIKNPAAKQSVALRSLSAVHRVALTGTPVENRLSELWSILEFLIPGYLGTASGFRRRFAVPIERHHDSEKAERLRTLIRPFVLRRLKSDPGIVADLPEKMEMKVFCNLTREQAALYESLVSDMLSQIDRAKGIARRGLILATLTKLKQICNHPSLFLQDGSTGLHRSGKCDRLAEMLEEVVASGEHALVFTQFRKMGDLLKPMLEDALDRETLFMHGGTTQKQRDKMIMRFQESRKDTPVFLLSLKAGGLGLNLTAASHVFHFDRWWNPAVEDQATDRAHRIGQDKQVQVHKYVCVGTLEERIDAMIEKKKDLADKIIGTGEEWLTELSTGALREMFALSTEAIGEE